MKHIHFSLLAALALVLNGCYDEPVANFDYSYSDNVAPALVTFSNYSTDAEDYLWNFGDGGTSTSMSPTHTYEDGGTFSISLKASGRGGENTMIKSITIIDPTSYIVRNYSSYTLYNVTSFYYDGVNILDDVNHGTMGPMTESNEVITERSEIYLAFEFQDGTLALVTNYFIMTPNKLNYITVTDNTQIVTESVEGLKATQSLEGLLRLRDEGKALPLNEVLK